MRDKGIDSIRVLLTFLVVTHHIAIVYGGSGDWYWKEATTTQVSLVAFNAINQSYFMGFFFLLSGYFARASIDNKGVKRFLQDRFIRLGIPLVACYFFLSPLTIAMANPTPNVPLFTQTFLEMKAHQFEPGPLWFVMALLIFSLIMAGVFIASQNRLGTLGTIPGKPQLATVLIAIGLAAFCVRLVIPVGETVIWLQLGYFPMYILLFAIGVLAFPNRLLANISFNTAIFWFSVSLLAICTLPLVITHPPGIGPFEGGANLNALTYALWEPLVACGVILGLLYFFNCRPNGLNFIISKLAPLAYCMFIIHPPVLVFTSLALFNWQQTMGLKFLVTSCFSLSLCLALSYCILRLPLARRIL